MNKIAAVTFVALVTFAAAAHAQPSDGEAPSNVSVPRRFKVDGTVGLATPVGEVGVEGAFVVHRNFEIGVGFGLANMIKIGDTGKPKPQVAVMPRFRLPVGPVRFTLGAGLSGGDYVVASSPFADGPYDSKTRALWLNGELAADYELRNGMYFGAYLGGGKVIAHTDVTDPHGTKLMTLPDSALPYIGVRVGYSF